MADYGEFTVDISRPPIFPPNRTCREGWLLKLYETKESIQRAADWDAYIKAYGIALREARKRGQQFRKPHKVSGE